MTDDLLFTIDNDHKKISVRKEFSANLPKVWAAWTDPLLLDQWWAPKPYNAKTKSMDFRPGGTWLYCMEGPHQEVHWSRADYKTIDKLKSFTLTDTFCDENGNSNTILPVSYWQLTFTPIGTNTVIDISITFENQNDLQTLLDTGFREGFSEGLHNLSTFIDVLK